MSNLRNINMNLLPILRELLRRRHVTRAAEALNMTQPAVSEALGRLRDLLHDQLLIHDGRYLVPTALAERLLPRLENALGEVESIFTSHFDKTQFSGTFKIATADYCALLLGAPIMRRLYKEAPRAGVHFLEASVKSSSDLRIGQIDFTILPDNLPSAPLEDFETVPLFEDDMVCVVGESSPHAGPMSLEDLAGKRHVTFSSAGDVNAHFGAQVLRQRGITHNDAICAPSFMLLPFLVEQTDGVAIVQRRLATRLAASANVRVVEPAVPFPRLRIVMAWNKARRNDPAHTWFRGFLIEIANEVSSKIS